MFAGRCSARVIFSTQPYRESDVVLQHSYLNRYCYTLLCKLSNDSSACRCGGMIDAIYADVIECAGASNYMCILLHVQHLPLLKETKQNKQEKK